MSLTTPQCPASGLIFEQVHNRLAGIPDIEQGRGRSGLGTEMDSPPHQRSGPQATGNLRNLPSQNPPQLVALGAEFIYRFLHLVEQPLHLSDIAGQNHPPGAQRLLLIEQARAVPEAAATIPARRSPTSSSNRLRQGFRLPQIRSSSWVRISRRPVSFQNRSLAWKAGQPPSSLLPFRTAAACSERSVHPVSL